MGILDVQADIHQAVQKWSTAMHLPYVHQDSIAARPGSSMHRWGLPNPGRIPTKAYQARVCL